jgi:hypothetical protein
MRHLARGEREPDEIDPAHLPAAKRREFASGAEE